MRPFGEGVGSAFGVEIPWWCEPSRKVSQIFHSGEQKIPKGILLCHHKSLSIFMHFVLNLLSVLNPDSTVFLNVVRLQGLEPWTVSLKGSCSTN